MNFLRFFILDIMLMGFLEMAAQPCDSCPGNFRTFHLQAGLDYFEYASPVLTFSGDSKIQLLRIDPEIFKIELFNSTALDTINRTAREWADSCQLTAVINAGMYNLKDYISNRGYMKNFRHRNQPKKDPNWGGLLAFNPKKSGIPEIEIFDINCTSFDEVDSNYETCIQSMRIFDCNGKAQPWKKRARLTSSICWLALDQDHKVWFIFTRSLYSMSDFIKIVEGMPWTLRKAVYLEGGPEASMYLCAGEFEKDLFGNYITNYHQIRNNEKIWKLPNVIGIKPKEKKIN